MGHFYFVLDAHDGGSQLALSRRLQGAVCDDRVGVLETGHGTDADDAPLRMVRHHDQAAAGLDQGPVRFRLEDVRCREARPRIDAVRAHEDHVDV